MFQPCWKRLRTGPDDCLCQDLLAPSAEIPEVHLLLFVRWKLQAGSPSLQIRFDFKSLNALAIFADVKVYI